LLSAAQVSTVPIELSDTEPATPRRLARDDEVVMRLAENPTTGYRWQLTQSGAGELELVEDRFVTGAAGAAPGAGGSRLVRFAGRKPGEVRIEAVLRRAWDPPQDGLQRRTFAITVD
jgi:inhibitor of cysteine peptidase